MMHFLQKPIDAWQHLKTYKAFRYPLKFVKGSLMIVGAPALGLSVWIYSNMPEKKTHKPPSDLPALSTLSRSDKDRLLKPWIEAQPHADQKDFATFYKKLQARAPIEDLRKEKTILIIDGGARLGIISARAVDEIEKNLGGPVAASVDYSIGTSAGALNVLACARGPDGRRLVSYETQEKTYRDAFFLKKRDGFINGINTPLLSSAALKQVIDGFAPENLWMSQLQDNVGIVVINADTGQSMILSSWEARRNPDMDFRVRDVALASSSALLVYETPEIVSATGRTWRFADGGIGLNNPISVAIGAARDNDAFLGEPDIRYAAFSLSNGTVNRSLPKNANGLVNLLEGIIGLSMNAPVDAQIKSVEADPNVDVISIVPALANQDGVIDFDPFDRSPQAYEAMTYIAEASAVRNQDVLGRITETFKVIQQAKMAGQTKIKANVPQMHPRIIFNPPPAFEH